MADDSKILIDNDELNQVQDEVELTSFKEYDGDAVEAALTNPITAPIKFVDARPTNNNNSYFWPKVVLGLSTVLSIGSLGLMGWLGYAAFLSTEDPNKSDKAVQFSAEALGFAAAAAGEGVGVVGLTWSGRKLCEGRCASNNTQPSNDIEMRDRTTTEMQTSSATDLAGQDASTTEGKSTAINIE